MKRETIEEWIGALIFCPTLGWVAWCEPFIWPLSFFFVGLTIWWASGKIIGWIRA